MSPYGSQYVPISTRGGPSCQVQNTDTRSAPEENSTRIHDSVFHFLCRAGRRSFSAGENAPPPVEGRGWSDRLQGGPASR
jgi:hypothetical protein